MASSNGLAGGAILLAAVTIGGCATTPPPTAAAPSSAVSGSAPSTSGALPEEAATLATLSALAVAADVDPGGYDRERFDYPAGGTDSRGCSTRARVLMRDSLDPPQVTDPGCKVLAGRWVDPYTGATYTSPAKVSIDHVVPLKEAWRSGAAAWSTERMVAFANDVTHRDALAAVEGSGNEQKGDKDPARWRPPDGGRWQTYATGWITVKATWGLTVDAAERAALESMLTSSPKPTPTPTPMAPPAPASSVPSTTVTVPAVDPAVGPPTSVYYASCAAAQAAGAAPLHRGESGFRDALDRDRNGTAC